jgi:ribosome-associated translation inhibitor RaiA
MQIPTQIVFRGIPHSDAVETQVRRHAAKLEQFRDNITSCRVTIERAGKHQHQGIQYHVNIDIGVPGEEIVVGHRHPREDLYVAVRDAFDAAARRLQERTRVQRREVKVHDVPFHGHVSKLFEDFGFVETADGREYYFHRDNCVSTSFDRLEIGAEVQFLENLGGSMPQAKRVCAGKHRLS